MIFDRTESFFFPEIVDLIREIRIKLSPANKLLKRIYMLKRERYKYSKTFFIREKTFAVEHHLGNGEIEFLFWNSFNYSADSSSYPTDNKTRKNAKRIVDQFIQDEAFERLGNLIRSHRRQAEKYRYVNNTHRISADDAGEWYP